MITDSHAGARNDSSVFLDFQERFYNDIFFPEIDKQGITTVIHLGDWMERRKYVNYTTLHRVKEFFFEPLKKRNIKTYLIIGNHDVPYKNKIKPNNARLTLEEYDNITIIDEPQTIDIEGFPVCMIPWICDDNEQASFKEMKQTKTDICMGHFAFNGFVMHQGQVAETGLDRSIMSKFDMVFSGHYHHRSTDGTIYYLGNPHEMTWQDYDDTKGFHTFDFATRELTFIANPYKMFHKITYNEDEINIKEFDYGHYTGYYVKIVVEKRTNMHKWVKFQEQLYNANPENVNVVENFIEVIELPEIVINQASDTPTLLEHFIEVTNVPSDIDKGILKDHFRSIYNDSLLEE